MSDKRLLDPAHLTDVESAILIEVLLTLRKSASQPTGAAPSTDSRPVPTPLSVPSLSSGFNNVAMTLSYDGGNRAVENQQPLAQLLPQPKPIRIVQRQRDSAIT